MNMAIRTMDDLPVTLNVEQVGVVLGISRAGAYNLVRSRDFPVIKIGKRLVIPKQAFLVWMENKANNANN